MIIKADNRFNPNPLSKIIATLILGAAILHSPGNISSYIIVSIYVLLYALQGKYKNAIGTAIVFLFYSILPSMVDAQNFPFLIQVLISMFVAFKLFYLPYMAGKFFFATSDVSSIITSMDKIKMPQEISIPIAVMFRFFPAYKEERKHIKDAMKIRGINISNPMKYLECFFVPLITISINTTDDIAKAAETKCIALKIKKTNYCEVKFKAIDYIFVSLIVIVMLGGIYDFI